MPIVKEPKPLPSALEYVPATSTPHKVAKTAGCDTPHPQTTSPRRETDLLVP